MLLIWSRIQRTEESQIYFWGAEVSAAEAECAATVALQNQALLGLKRLPSGPLFQDATPKVLSKVPTLGSSQVGCSGHFLCTPHMAREGNVLIVDLRNDRSQSPNDWCFKKTVISICTAWK